jgi:hypothetical protein
MMSRVLDSDYKMGIDDSDTIHTSCFMVMKNQACADTEAVSCSNSKLFLRCFVASFLLQ